MKKSFFYSTILLFSTVIIAQANPAAKGDYVVLIHGLFRSHTSLDKIEEHLKSLDYQVLNLVYDSRSTTIEGINKEFLEPGINEFCTDSTKQIHFVTHSMGGIILRYYLNTHPDTNVGRIVMLAPPNKGSELVPFFENNAAVREIMGPAFTQLSSDSGSFVNLLQPVKEEIGVITGNRTFNFINSIIIPGPDDGKVSVERARLDEMKDFLVVEHSHPFIMTSDDVIEQIVFFFDNGNFKKL